MADLVVAGLVVLGAVNVEAASCTRGLMVMRHAHVSKQARPHIDYLDVYLSLRS